MKWTACALVVLLTANAKADWRDAMCGKLAPKIPAPPVVKPLPATRPAQTHTHTHWNCPKNNGNPVTWDHANGNNSHACPLCGAQVWVQDRTPRPVTLLPTASYYPRPVATVFPGIQNPTNVPSTATTIQRTFRSYSSGCPAGGCPYVR